MTTKTKTVSELSLEEIREKNKSVDQRISELEAKHRELQDCSEALDSVCEALDVDDSASVLDAIQTLQEHTEDLEKEVMHYQHRELETIKEDISHGSDYTMDDLKNKDMDELEIIQESLYRIRGVQ